MHTASLGGRDGLNSAQVTTPSHIIPSPSLVAHLAVSNDAVCILSYEYLFKAAKSDCAVKRIGESVRWADRTIRLVVKANNMSARNVIL